MGWFLKRLAGAMLAAWVISSGLFLLGRGLLTSPDQQLSQAADLTRTGQTSASQHQARSAALQHRLGLDGPVFYVSRFADQRWQYNGLDNQYHRWARGVLHGDLGRSFRDGEPVTDLLGRALRVTVPLMLVSFIVVISLSLVLGLYLAAKPGGRRRAMLRTTLSALHVTPVFVLALVLLLLLANPDMLNIVPADVSTPPVGLAGVGYWVARALLPGLVLVLTGLADLTLPFEASLRREWEQDYVRTARAKGLSVRRILTRHALPNAVLPVLSNVSGMLPALIGGSVVVEITYSLPGTGRLLAEASAAHDTPVLNAGILLVAVAYGLSQVAADVVQRRLDPRTALLSNQ